MITGDNAQTGVYVARASTMLGPEQRIFLADAKQQAIAAREGELAVVKESVFEDTDVVFWREMGTPASATPPPPLSTPAVLAMVHGQNGGSIELAMTGRAFSHFYQSPPVMDQLLFHTRIFARFSPTQKSDTVDLFIDRGLVTAMCGDGGNDCGALRTAHVGLALSEAEASVVSPFTSKTKSLSSMVDLLREGRCALATSFATYKFVLTYGQSYLIAKISYVYYDTSLAGATYLVIDVAMILCLTYSLTLSKPKDELTKDRPTSSLLGPHTFLSVFGTSIMNATFLGICFGVMAQDPNYIEWPLKCANPAFWFLQADNWETTVITIVFLYQLSFAGFVFAIGGRFRKAVWTNPLVCILFVIFQAFMLSIVLSEPNDWTRIFHISSFNFNGEDAIATWANYQNKGFSDSGTGSNAECKRAYPECGCDGEMTDYGMPYDLRVTILVICYINQFCMLVFNVLVIEGPVRLWCIANKYPIKRLEFGL
jgi:cation-transporting ATPase 13A3/4/5